MAPEAGQKNTARVWRQENTEEELFYYECDALSSNTQRDNTSGTERVRGENAKNLFPDFKKSVFAGAGVMPVRVKLSNRFYGMGNHGKWPLM